MKRSFRIVVCALALFVAALFTRTASAEVLLDVPPIETTNAFLFVDYSDPLAYYYIPKGPRVSVWPDGTPKFTFIKYKKTGKDISGGIVHFLVNYGLTQDEIKEATKELQDRLRKDKVESDLIARGVTSDPTTANIAAAVKKIQSGASKAKVMGPVPFIKGEFNIISASAGVGGIFTRKLVGTGKAPLLAGQDAAVSIALTEEGATFLWESFKAPTSDVSVQFVMTYEGLTPAFKAKLTVDWDKVWEHTELHAEVGNFLSSAHLTKICDDLKEQGAIKLEVIGEDANMEGLLQTAYATLVQMMFDAKPVKPEDLGKEYDSSGSNFLGKLFGGANVGFYSKEVHMTGHYTVDLTRRKRDQREMPMTGNVGDIYKKFKDNPRIFQFVDLDDPAFQERTVYVILDGEDYDTFKDYINFAGITFRRKKDSGEVYTQDALFDQKAFQEGGNKLPFTYARMGNKANTWLDYEYQAVWSVKGGLEKRYDWTKTSAPVITLTPPYRYRQVEVLADDENMTQFDVLRIAVKFRHTYLGKKVEREVILRRGDALNTFYRYPTEPDNLDYEYNITFLRRNNQRVETGWRKGSDPFVYVYFEQAPGIG